MSNENAFDLTIDPAEMTMGDLIDFEEITGTGFDELGGTTRDPKTGEKVERKPSAKQLAALIFLSRRRQVPGYTFEDAKNEKISVFNTDKADKADPSEPAV